MGCVVHFRQRASTDSERDISTAGPHLAPREVLTRHSMSACGSGKSSKGGGSKSRGKSVKGDAFHKKVHMQTSKEHLATLRGALRDELGNDRNVLAGFGAFTKYDRGGLALDVHFRTGGDIADDELEWAYELVSSNLGPLGHRFNPQDKMDDLCDPASRYALVTERPAAATSAEKAVGRKGKKKKGASVVGRPVAFAHFRFTVEGETQDAMAGVPVLMLRDLHVEPALQRKGVGKHLCQLLELTARKHSMQGLMVLAPAGEAGQATRGFLASKLRGFENVDNDWAPKDKYLSAFAKSLVKSPAGAAVPASPVPSVTVKTAVDEAAKGPASSPDSVMAGPGGDDAATPSPTTVNSLLKEKRSKEEEEEEEEEKDEEKEEVTCTPGAMEGGVARLEAAFEKASLSSTPAPAPLFGEAFAPVAVAVKAPSMSFADFGMAPAEEDVSDDEEDGDGTDGDSEWEEVGGEEGLDEDEEAEGDAQADDILSQLVDLFKAENGRDPTEEEMAQWVQTLKEAAAEGGLALC